MATVADMLDWFYTLPLNAEVVATQTGDLGTLPVVGLVCDYTTNTVRIAVKED